MILPMIFLASAGFSPSHSVSFSFTRVFDHGADFGGDEFVFRLAGEFGVRHFDGEDAGEAFAGVIAGQFDLFLFGDAGFFGVFVDAAGQRGAEALEVGAAVALRDVVGEAEGVLVIAIIPLERDADGDAVCGFHGEAERAVDGAFGAVEPFGEFDEAAFVVEFHGFRFDAAQIAQHQEHAGVEEGEFAQARGEIKITVLEGFERGQKVTSVPVRSEVPTDFSGARATPWRSAWSIPCLRADAQVEDFGKGVDDRDANAVETAGNFVAVLVELTAAWSWVMMTSAALMPSSLWIPTGMPRPLSEMVTEPLGLRVTSTRLAWPARASSMALSTTS